MTKSKLQNKVESQRKNGFTLVELLVSISILSIAILATFTAISNNLRSSNFSQDQVTAYYLADEGIEFVRNWRDQNGIANINAFATGGSVPWLSGIANVAGDPCYPGKVCYIDSPLKTVQTCSGDATTCPYIREDSASGLYGYTASWTQTQFNRSITIAVNSPTEANVSVSVSWVTNGVSKNYVLSETLESWQ